MNFINLARQVIAAIFVSSRPDYVWYLRNC